MKINYILLFLLSLLYAGGVSAASEAEYRKLSKACTLHADGSQEYRYSMELTLFTHTAMNRTYGETFIVYNPQYQEVKIHNSYTIQKDGNKVTTPGNAFVEVLPRAAANAPAWNHLKELVIVHTGLELGATIYLDYSVITQPGYLPALDLFEPLQQTSPVKEYTVSLTVPATSPLFYTFHQAGGKVDEKSGEGVKQVVWTARNLPAASRAPEVIPANGDLPWLAASTFSSEEEALNYLKNQYDGLNYSYLQTVATPLVANVSGEKEKWAAIQSYITTQLDLSPLSLMETSFRVRPAEEIIQSAYATETEKAFLLASLLKAAGLKAEPAFAYKTAATEGTKGLSSITESLVVMQLNGETFPLNVKNNRPTIHASRQAYQPIKNIEGQTVRLTDRPADIRYEANLKITPDQPAEAIVTEECGSYWLAYTPGAEAKKTTPVPVTIESRGGYKVVTLPVSGNGIENRPYKTYNSVRTDNLLLPHPVKEEYSYTIELTDGQELRTPLTHQTISNKAGTLTRSIEKVGDQVKVRRSLQLSDTLITAENYKDFRTLITAWGDPQSRMLLITP